MKNFLVCLLFLAPTISYRFELGSFSIALVEPLILIVSGILLLHIMSKKQSTNLFSEPIMLFFFVLILWSLIASLLGWLMNHLVLNPTAGLSDLRNWVIPFIGFTTLLIAIEGEWRKWSLVFFALVVLSAGIGIYQHLTDSFRPFIAQGAEAKQVFFSSGEIQFADFAVGFFVHPNDFAIYLFLGLMIGIGWLVKTKHFWMIRLPMLLIVGTSLYLTYAKTSIVVMVMALSFFLLHLTIRADKPYRVGLIAFGIGILVAVWLAFTYLPYSLFESIWWRTGLWDRVSYVIETYPLIGILGNGMDAFAANSYYPQPHSLYFSMLLFYGLFGVGWIIMLFLYLGYYGLQLRKEGFFEYEPMLATLWIALLGYFAIGLVESTLTTIEMRSIFFWIMACFLGLVRELKNEQMIFFTLYPYTEQSLATPYGIFNQYESEYPQQKCPSYL